MNIFEKRPLSLILCIMLGGFSLFADTNTTIRLTVAAILLVLFVATFIFEHKIPGSNGIIRISLVAASIGILLSLCWSLAFFPTKHYDNTVDVTARVYDIDTSSYNAKITVKTIDICEQNDEHKLLLYINRDIAQTLEKYDIIKFSADLGDFKKNDDGSGGRTYYISKGFSGYLENADGVSVIGNETDEFDKFMSDIRLKLSNILKKRTNFQTGAFLSALIFGQREDLDGNTRLNFSRIGISHVLALSGMHLAILTAAITKIFMLLGINKKLRISFISIFTLGYMTLTGFSPSVFRAGVMLLIAGVLYLLSRSSDSITSLFIAVTVILVFIPYAVYDLSLWLSAFATLGVIVFAEMKKESAKEPDIDEKFINIKSFLRFIKDGILVSLFAFGATFAISASSFNGFSALSIITTLIFSIFIELMIYAGLLILLLGWMIPIGRPVILLSDFIKEFAELLSDTKWVYVSSDSTLVKLFIAVFTAFFFVFLIFKTEKKKMCLIVVVSLLGIVFGIAEIDAAIVRNTNGVTYSPNTAGDVFVLRSEGNVSVLYSGKEYLSAAYEISDTLSEQKINYIDRLVLANYSYSTSAFCEKLLSNCKTTVIYVPKPQTNDEINQAEGLADTLSLWGARLEFYEMIDKILFDDYSLRFFNRNPYEYGEYPMNVFNIYGIDKTYTYISAGDYNMLNIESKAALYNCENLFVGTGGNTKYYKFDMLLPRIKSINYAEEERLTETATNYYISMNADINLIKSSKKIDE